jgi:hypothetical protein
MKFGSNSFLHLVPKLNFLLHLHFRTINVKSFTKRKNIFCNLFYTTKDVVCNYLLVAYDNFMCIKQVAKDIFSSNLKDWMLKIFFGLFNIGNEMAWGATCNYLLLIVDAKCEVKNTNKTQKLKNHFVFKCMICLLNA